MISFQFITDEYRVEREYWIAKIPVELFELYRKKFFHETGQYILGMYLDNLR